MRLSWQLLLLYKFKSTLPSKEQEVERFARAFAATSNIVLITSAAMMLAFCVACGTSIVAVQSFALFCVWITFTGYLTYFTFIPAVIVTAGKRPRNCEAASGRRCIGGLEDVLAGAYVTNFVGQRGLRWLVIATTLVLLVVFLIFSVVRLDVDRNPVSDTRTWH